MGITQTLLFHRKMMRFTIGSTRGSPFSDKPKCGKIGRQVCSSRPLSFSASEICHIQNLTLNDAKIFGQAGKSISPMLATGKSMVNLWSSTLPIPSTVPVENTAQDDTVCSSPSHPAEACRLEMDQKLCQSIS